MRSIVLVAATLVALTAFTSIPARADGAWCAYDVRGGTNCGFHTYEQCLAQHFGDRRNLQPATRTHPRVQR